MTESVPRLIVFDPPRMLELIELYSRKGTPERTKLALALLRLIELECRYIAGTHPHPETGQTPVRVGWIAPAKRSDREIDFAIMDDPPAEGYGGGTRVLNGGLVNHPSDDEWGIHT